MNCRRSQTLIYDFIDGVINDQDRLALEQHLGGCQSCETIATGLSKSLDLLHRVEPVQLSDNFAWKVRLGIAREKRAMADVAGTERSWLRSWNRRFAFSAVSAFAVMAIAGYATLRSPVFTTVTTALSPVATPNVTEVARSETKKSSATAGRSNDAPVKLLPKSVGPQGVFLGTGGVSTVSTDPRQPLTDSAGFSGALEETRDSYDLDIGRLRARVQLSKSRELELQQLQQQVEFLTKKLQVCDPHIAPAE